MSGSDIMYIRHRIYNISYSSDMLMSHIAMIDEDDMIAKYLMKAKVKDIYNSVSEILNRLADLEKEG